MQTLQPQIIGVQTGKHGGSRLFENGGVTLQFSQIPVPGVDHILYFQREVLSFTQPVDVFSQSIQSCGCGNLAFLFQQVGTDTLPMFLFFLNGLFHILRLNVDHNSQILKRVLQKFCSIERHKITFGEIVQSKDIVEISIGSKTGMTGFFRSNTGIFTAVNL